MYLSTKAKPNVSPANNLCPTTYNQIIDTNFYTDAASGAWVDNEQAVGATTGTVQFYLKETLSHTQCDTNTMFTIHRQKRSVGYVNGPAQYGVGQGGYLYESANAALPDGYKTR